jgi:hypothetical protein
LRILLKFSDLAPGYFEVRGSIPLILPQALGTAIPLSHDRAVGQARLAVHTDVQLHAERPMLALAGLVHLGVELAFGRSW